MEQTVSNEQSKQLQAEINMVYKTSHEAISKALANKTLDLNDLVAKMGADQIVQQEIVLNNIAIQNAVIELLINNKIIKQEDLVAEAEKQSEMLLKSAITANKLSA